MPTYDAGDARLRIVPDAREFRAKLEADLKRIQATYAVNVTANTAQATADIRRFRDVEQRNDLRMGVDVALAQAQADLARFRALQQADGITIPVDVDGHSLQRARQQVSSAFAGIGGDLFSAVKWNTGAGAIALLPTMATGVAGLTSALQELSQAGLVLPGIMAAAGASLGTVLLGTSGLKDAFKELGKQDGSQKQLDKLNALLADLSPNAREFVTAVAEIKPAFDDLQNTVQDNLFAGIGDQLQTLANQDLPNFKAGLGGIATALNHNLGEVMRVLGTDSSRGLLDRILGNTSDAQERFTAAIEPMLNGLGTLAAGSTDVLPRLADGFGKATDRFNAFITEADQDGRLDTWINDGIDGLTHLGNTFINLGKSLNAITTAMGGGDGLLSMLETGSERLQAFLNSAQGQDMLRNLFERGREELDKWLPLLETLPGLLGGVLNASSAWMDVILPPLTQVSQLLAEHPGLVQAVATAFLAWKSIQGIASVVAGLQSITTLLGTGIPAASVLATASVGGLAAALAAAAAPIAGLLWLNNKVRHDWVTDGTPSSERAFQLSHGGELQPGDIWKSPSNGTLGDVLGAPPPPAPKGPVFGPAVPGGSTVLPPLTPRDTAGLLGGSFGTGGATRSGRGNGPTGGWLSELHSDEWVVNARGRANLGDDFLTGANAGQIPGFKDGGTFDEWGNPVTRGRLPGPVAPNPSSGGGLGSVLGGALGGMSGLLGGAAAGGGKAGGDGPQDFAHQWFPWLSGFEKTGDPFANAPDKLRPQNIAYEFGQTLLGGVLGGLGLDNSILSPTNPYNKAIQSTAGFYSNKFGAGATGGAAALSDADVTSMLTGAGLNPDQIKAVITSRDQTAQRDAMTSKLEGLGLSSSDVQAAMKALGGNGKAPAANYAGGSDDLHTIVYEAFKSAGFDDSQWPALVNLINHESNWNPKAQNPSGAYGIAQFMPYTWATVGGKKTSSAAEQARLMMIYIKGRYGDPTQAWAQYYNHAGGEGSYAVGGFTPGSESTPLPSILHGGEFVQRARAVSKYGVPFMTALNKGLIDPAELPHFAVGGLAGDVSRGVVQPPSPDESKVTPLGALNPQPAGPGKQLQALRPPAGTAPNAPPQPHLAGGEAPGPAPAPSQQKDKQKPFNAPLVAAAPSSTDHELPALKKAVTSTASTLGSLVQSAAGASPMPGAGQAGAMAAGLIKQGGKIVNDVINIPSSFLVGNITPGTQDSAYGTTLTSPMRQPSNSPTRVTNYGGIYGHDMNQVIQELDIRDAQDNQAALAAHPR